MLMDKPAHDGSESHGGGRSSTTVVTAVLPTLNNNSRMSGHDLRR